MRRSSLIALLGIFLYSAAHANTINLNTVSADATAAGINGNFTAIANAINGNIQGSTDGTSVVNISADSVYEINMANDANVRVYSNELLGIGSDTFASGTLTQNAVVESGLVPATDSDLTSDVSAGTAYVNGYRVSKSAEALTYPASMDTYLDLSQSGVYTQTAVANGGTQPAVAANSVRLAKVVTDGTSITTVTSLYTTRIPGLIIPSDYRDQMVVSRDSSTTLTVGVGHAEINNAIISKTTPTTLTISTAGDWAGGTSLRAADTFGFVGLDASGNLKMHTTAPAYENYALTTTSGKLRYASWSSTTYRILGWFYMDGNGSGNIEVASNIKDWGVSNAVQSVDLTVSAFSSTSLTDIQRIPFYNSGGNVMVISLISGDGSAGITQPQAMFQRGSTNLTDSIMGLSSGSAAGYNVYGNNTYLDTTAPQAGTTYDGQFRVSANTVTLRGRKLIVRED